MKKCENPGCGICTTLSPRRVPADVPLDFLPDPVADENGGYKGFDETYGTDTDDSGRPSLRNKTQPSQADRNNRQMFVAGKIKCSLDYL